MQCLTTPISVATLGVSSYVKLLTVAMEECFDSRGGYSLIVREPDKMLPLQPRTRLLLVEALHEHLRLQTKLNQLLKARRCERFIDGSELFSLLELGSFDGFDEEMISSLRDPQWAVRTRGAMALTDLFDCAVDEDHCGLFHQVVAAARCVR